MAQRLAHAHLAAKGRAASEGGAFARGPCRRAVVDRPQRPLL